MSPFPSVLDCCMSREKHKPVDETVRGGGGGALGRRLLIDPTWWEGDVMCEISVFFVWRWILLSYFAQWKECSYYIVKSIFSTDEYTNTVAVKSSGKILEVKNPHEISWYADQKDQDSPGRLVEGLGRGMYIFRPSLLDEATRLSTVQSTRRQAKVQYTVDSQYFWRPSGLLNVSHLPDTLTNAYTSMLMYFRISA